MATKALREDAAVPAGAVSVAVVAWRFGGMVRATAVAKATFALAADAVMPRVAPEPIVHAEVHYDDSPARSIRLTTDLAPYLNRADVLLTGHAYAPRGVFVETLPVRLGLFDGARPVLDKTVLVRQKGGLKRVPLVYERAYGGLGFADNPFGVGATTGSGEPNILDSFDDRRVAGLGPIGQIWPARKRLLGSLPRRALDPSGIMDLPDAFEWEYFQAAPPDQRVPFLRGDEWIVMDGLHPRHARLRSQLPGARGIALVYGLSPWGVVEGQPIALHADTLRIDADEQRCSLTFRATFPIAEEALASLRVVLGVELPGSPVTWPDPAEIVAHAQIEVEPDSETVSMPLSDDEFESVRGDVLIGTLTFEPKPPRGPALPFQGSASAPSALRQAGAAPRPAPRADHPLSGTLAQTPEEFARAAQRSVLPFGEKSPSVPPPPLDPSPPLTTAEPPEPPAPSAPAPVAEKRAAASPWAPPAAPARPEPVPPPPPPAMGPPAATPTLKKGLYGRFGKR
jgi:hypothetical protein